MRSPFHTFLDSSHSSTFKSLLNPGYANDISQSKMPNLEVDILWKETFPAATRPELYSSSNTDSDGFQPLTDAEAFVQDPASLTHLQLFAASLNNQIALKAAQDEYSAISQEIFDIKGRDINVKDPQALLDFDDFEDRKEAALYDYKYEVRKPALMHITAPGNKQLEDISEQEKRDVRLLPEPFMQAGFVALTEKIHKSLLAKAKNKHNPDGWAPIQRHGRRMIPQQQEQHDEYNVVYIKRNVDENGEIIYPDSVASDDFMTTPSKAIDKRLTRTRFGGRKVPPTRETSETPSVASTPSRKRGATPMADHRDGTPASKRAKTATLEPMKPDRPKHPNQYTKAKEAAARAVAEAAAAGVPPPPQQMPDWSRMTSDELRGRKWSDEELIDSLRRDHSWLHADPAKALEWKDKILNGINPVRSWSMVKKWAEWRRENKDKRPRKKELTPLLDALGENAPSPALSGSILMDENRELKREDTEESNGLLFVDNAADNPRRSLRHK